MCGRHKAQRMVRNRGSAAAAPHPVVTAPGTLIPSPSAGRPVQRGSQPQVPLIGPRPPPFSSPKDVGVSSRSLCSTAGRAETHNNQPRVRMGDDAHGCNEAARPHPPPPPRGAPPAREVIPALRAPAARALRASPEAGAAPEKERRRVPTRQLLPWPLQSERPASRSPGPASLKPKPRKHEMTVEMLVRKARFPVPDMLLDSCGSLICLSYSLGDFQDAWFAMKQNF